MKKTIALLLLLIMVFPSQTFAASVSKSHIEKLYFESYKDQVKEVKTAQKNISKAICPDVQMLTSKYKASLAAYKQVVKSKPSKEVKAKARAEKDQDKKLLRKAKKDCIASKKNFKIESNKSLKDIAAYKAKLVQTIKTHLEGKETLTKEQFSKTVNEGTTYIDSKFKETLDKLRTFTH